MKINQNSGPLCVSYRAFVPYSGGQVFPQTYELSSEFEVSMLYTKKLRKQNHAVLHIRKDPQESWILTPGSRLHHPNPMAESSFPVLPEPQQLRAMPITLWGRAFLWPSSVPAPCHSFGPCCVPREQRSALPFCLHPHFTCVNITHTHQWSSDSILFLQVLTIGTFIVGSSWQSKAYYIQLLNVWETLKA